MKSIDLNADLGEGAGTDAELLQIVSSANIACGGHAGDAATMRATIRASKACGVAIGAHPGFADKENFGRKRLDLEPAELEGQIRGQLIDFKAIADAEGATITHLKLHGALANMAAENQSIATACYSVSRDVLGDVAFLAIDNSEQVKAAELGGMKIVREAYADRAYTPAGLLVPRNQSGAVLTDIGSVTAQCLRLAMQGEIVAIDGSVLVSKAQSLCIHGDTDDAVLFAREVRKKLENAGIMIAAPY